MPGDLVTETQRQIYLAKWGSPQYDYGIDGVEKALAEKQAKAALAVVAEWLDAQNDHQETGAELAERIRREIEGGADAQ